MVSVLYTDWLKISLLYQISIVLSKNGIQTKMAAFWFDWSITVSLFAPEVLTLARIIKSKDNKLI